MRLDTSQTKPMSEPLTESRGQITRRIVLVFDDVIAFVDGIKKGESVPDGKQSRQVFGDQSLSRGTWRRLQLKNEIK